MYSLTIGGTDRSRCLVAKSAVINDTNGSSATTLQFQFSNYDGLGCPQIDDEVILTNTNTLFAGRIQRMSGRLVGDSDVLLNITCLDYMIDLDRNLVREEFEDMTDKAIIEYIVNQYCGGTGITYDNVVEGETFTSIIFNYEPPSECFSRLSKVTGREWWIDYNKDIHYQMKTTTDAPFNIKIL